MVINSVQNLPGKNKKKTVSFVIDEITWEQFSTLLKENLALNDIDSLTPSVVIRSWIATSIQGNTINLSASSNDKKLLI
tara:strand:- start:111 stop:347 length:237 start_codon:yes stop_codon:yes gene_type:complete